MNAEIAVKNYHLPVYSEKEETFNVCSHTVGVLLGIGMIVSVSQFYKNNMQLVFCVIGSILHCVCIFIYVFQY